MSQERQPVGEFAVLQVKHELSHGKHVVPTRICVGRHEVQFVEVVEQAAHSEAHEPHTPEDWKYPDPQVPQVELALDRIKGREQLVQAEADPAQVRQFELQGKQVEPEAKYPAPHVPQVAFALESSKGGVQLVHVVEVLEQVKQLESQG